MAKFKRSRVEKELCSPRNLKNKLILKLYLKDLVVVL